MNYTYRLLSQEQVFGEERIDVIRAIGTKCGVSDFAALSGVAGQGSAGRWFLSSTPGYGDVCAVDESGSQRVAYSTSRGGVRPVMECADLSGLSCESRKDISGFEEAEFGEYPQNAADKTLAGTLEQEFAEGLLRKTGKTYQAQYEEFQYEGAKYIRVPYLLEEGCRLSNGKNYGDGDPVWIKVSPVKWLYDKAAGLLVSKTILASGMLFSAENYYDGDFEKTAMHTYLNTSLAADLRPSELRVMTPEEEAEYEENRKRVMRRKNPYGLKFGEVSEEDIIKGAIESNVPVFLHGPSSEGKSARVKQIDPDCVILYLRNATPDSLNGRSVYNQSTGEMIDIPPAWFKKVQAKCQEEPDKLHVVFFDEINNALPSIQGMAFNIVLDREVNGIWRLPDNARIVAAGNDMKDSLAAQQLAAPFFNRFAHVYINTTTEKWLKWARENKIHPAIYAYIACKRGETLRSKYDGEKPNADPRKWEMASKMLYGVGRPEMLRALIGEDITEEFVQFCSQPVITLEDVLSGNYSDRELENMNTSQRYATTVGLTQADDENLETVRNFVSKLGEEFRAVFDSYVLPEEEK
ncbi:ATP-binding protein [bacterium 210820-DFI.6.37]|nr:ATP-binding protein [bacterium 210820-DFI.6.37]